jgi:hypothetical protein
MRGVTVGNLVENTQRNAANLAWMRECFALAPQAVYVQLTVLPDVRHMVRV